MKPKTPIKSPITDTIRDLMLLIITIASIYLLLAPDSSRLRLPLSLDDLQGVWTTTHPRYKDRYLQFSDGRVAFGWGEDGAGAYAVEEFDSEAAEDSTLVNIRYVDMDATDYGLSFHYADQGGGMIWMKGQKGVHWIRTSSQPLYAPVFR
jgi:hypothetical protein